MQTPVTANTLPCKNTEDIVKPDRPRSLTNDSTIELDRKVKLLKNELKDMTSKLSVFSQSLNEYVKLPLSINSRAQMNHSWSPINMTTKMYGKTLGPDVLPDRIYIRRESLLTEMFKITHVGTIRNIFISIMIILGLQVIVNDLMDKGKIDLNFILIQWAFDKIQTVFLTWMYMKFFTTCVVYQCFHQWSKGRIDFLVAKKKQKDDLKAKDITSNAYDLSWLALFIVYMIAFTIIPAYVVIDNSLPPASAIALLTEQIRLLMKTYAFVRSNVPRALTNGSYYIQAGGYTEMNLEGESTKEHNQDSDLDENKTTDNKRVLCPEFSRYLYFLFAPTLVYRDYYPRTTRVDWNVVVSNLAQVLMSIFYVNYVFVRFCIPVFQDFSKKDVTLATFIKSILNCHLPGTLLLLIGFFAFLHCWLNAFAEMLCFGDRMFYKDWWNSTNFSMYYRTWNCVVHDFLYTYIYKDAYYLFGKRYRTLSQFAIFFISAVFHEYILTLAFGFFYPVLFLMFGGLGFTFMFIKPERNSNFWNFVIWAFLQIGLGGVMCLYSIEWFARQNCKQAFESKLYDYLIPRSFSCGSHIDSNLAQSNATILLNATLKTEL